MSIQEEDTPFLEDDGLVQIKIPKRKIIIEPLMLGFSLFSYPMLSVTQLYIIHRIAEDHGGNITNTNETACTANINDSVFKFTQQVQQEASYFSLYQDILVIIPAMFAAMFLGNYSDKAGRKYAILPPLVGQCASALCYFLVVWLHLPLKVLFLGSFLYGTSGSYGTFLLGSLAYTADITPKENRVFRIAVIEMCMLTPIILSSVGMGYWIETMGFIYPSLFVLIGQILLILYTIFCIPETIIPRDNAKFFSFSHLQTAIRLFTKDNGSNRRWKLNMLLAAIFFPMMALLGMNIDTLYMTNQPLCLDPFEIGVVQGVDVAVIVVGGLIGAKTFKYCLSDLGIVFLSGVCSIAKYTYNAFVSTFAMMLSSKYCLILHI